ncbi:DUF3895 domain-containing protein [Halobacillus trueperi]|uniref:DUF3895 domain-containing protein n=1 Tax=Halobacillus trueperi TaxID=156205 RepID=A0A3D8VN92_9BACI|nr:DUF3895 domain-containing protein [Halobacillus trueperi]RDY70866.1 DUF3895 domain-containing protein [Halobacillus trueperi]
MGSYILTVKERDSLLNSIDEIQKDFIINQLKRGRKTIFANVLAADKGRTSSGHVEWELVDYQDGGTEWNRHKELQCECGKILRYQYTVKNRETGTIRKFGINHFIEHTDISSELAKAIVRGWENIDYEMDELLTKIQESWTLDDIIAPDLLEPIDIPNDIQEHFDVGLPLLDRQVRRLKVRVNEYSKKQEGLRVSKLKENEQQSQEEMKQQRGEMVSQLESLGISENLILEKELQLGILVYLKNTDETRISAKNICQYLIELHGAPSETYPGSSALRIFPNICVFLKKLVDFGNLELIENKGIEDRIYRKGAI